MKGNQMIHRARLVLPMLLVGLLTASTLLAGYNEGVRAYMSKDYKRALRELKADGSPASNYILGVMYFKGEGVAVDKGGAVKFLRASAEHGYVKAEYSLAVIYDKGDGVAQNQQEAVQWYHKAAGQGHAESQFDLGVIYTNGEGVAKDRQEAVKWLRKAAVQGHARARKLLRVMGEKY